MPIETQGVDVVSILKGCLDPNSASYDSDANVAADRCDDLPFQDPAASNESGQTAFGGVYTTCEGPADLCSRYTAFNLATGSTSCPHGFMAVNLLSPQVNSHQLTPQRPSCPISICC